MDILFSFDIFSYEKYGGISRYYVELQKHLNKIKPWVLTDFDVEFGGNGSFGMFASSGAPSVVNLSMTFQEVQLITRSDVKAGY